MWHRKKQSGFTIVELLIVVVVIAILAAITIVAYNGIQNRAKQSAAQSTASQGAKKITLWQVDNPNQSPSVAQFTELVGSGNVDQYQYSAGANGAFCITATKNNVSYYASNTQTSPVAGACDGHGANGTAPITNMATNPNFELSTTGYSANAAALTIDSAWSQNGSSSLRMSPNLASNDTFANLGGDLGGLRLGMEAGKTYTISGTIRLTGPLTGTLSGSSRKITAWYTVGTTHTALGSATAPNAAGSTRLSVTMAVPATANAAWLRFYNGASTGGGDVWWDSIMMTEGTAQQPFADGTTAGWAWNGTPHASTSSGPAL